MVTLKLKPRENIPRSMRMWGGEEERSGGEREPEKGFGAEKSLASRKNQKGNNGAERVGEGVWY